MALNAGDVIVRLIVELKKFGPNLTKAQGLVRRFATKTNAMFKSLANKTQQWMRRLTIAVTAAITLSIRELAKLEEQMANVSTMLDDHTMRLMPGYEKAVRSMSVQFGEGSQTITKGLYDILSASIPADQAIGVLETSMKAAAAGMTTTAVAADGITTVLNAYGFEAKYAGLVSDRLFSIVKSGKITFDQIASSIGGVVSNAALAGIEFEVVGAAISTMTRSGVDASEAVTALNALLMGFIEPTKEAHAVAKKYGFALNTAALEGDGLLTILEKLHGASADEIGDLTKRIRGYKALAIMSQNVEGVTRDYSRAIQSAGITNKQLDKVMQSLMMKFKQFWQLLIDIGRTAIEPFADDMKQLIDYTIKHRDEIVAWVRSVTSSLDKIGEYVSGGFTISVKTGFDMLTEIARTAGKAIFIILEETFIAIGRNVPVWIIKGIRFSGQNLSDIIASEFTKRSTLSDEDLQKWAKLHYAKMKGAWEKQVKTSTETIFTTHGPVPITTRTEVEVPVDAEKWRKAMEMAAEGYQEILSEVVSVESTLGPRLSALYSELATTLEEIKVNAEDAQPALDKFLTLAEKIGGAWLTAGKQIWDALTIPEKKLPEIEAAGKKAIDALKDEPHKWQESWDTAAASIDGAFEDAFVNITKNVKNASDIIENLVDSITEAVTRMIYQQYIAGQLVNAIGGALGMPATTSSQQTPPEASRAPAASGGAKGGIVYARRGVFMSKGTDTVPAMLTPGEAVVPKGVTDWFRKMFGGSGGSGESAKAMTVNVNAIDAAGTYQFLNKNKRAIASMMGNARDQNHPSRRNTQ